MSVDVYVYYRVDPERLDDAACALARTFTMLRDHCHDAPRAQRRTDEATTWMEIYPGVRDCAAFAAALDAAAENFTGLLVGERHIETFVALISGANA